MLQQKELLSAYKTISPSKKSASTAFDVCSTTVIVDEKLLELNIWDTACQEKYDKLRPLSYRQANVFLICFSVTDIISFENTSIKWYPEVNHHCPKARIILVGTNIDRRDDPESIDEFIKKHNRDLITYDEGLAKAKEIGAECYRECSALTQKGVKQVFEDAAKAAIYGQGYFDLEGNFLIISLYYIYIYILDNQQ